MSVSKIVAAAASSAGGAGLDVDEVFSTFLYDGTSSSLTINNGIDLSGEGGLTWIKARNFSSSNHALFDTARGGGKYLQSNEESAQETPVSAPLTFNSNGFTINTQADSWNGTYYSNTYTSWTFRKAKKFFDVVTYTGNGSAQTISHNLGTTVGWLLIKRTDTTGSWFNYHHGFSKSGNPQGAILNETGAAFTANASLWNLTYPTSTHFTVGDNNSVNASGGTYVAYLFAHNDSGDGGFGPDGDQDIIKCGSYTGNTSTRPSIDLGFEPQFLMIKRTDSADNWYMLDTMRGIVTSGGNDTYLYANSSSAEATVSEVLKVTATGFQLEDDFGGWNASGGTYIYMAIRRGPLAAPDDATKVFNVDAGTTINNLITTGFNVDVALTKGRNGTSGYLGSRLTGDAKFLQPNATDAEADYDGFSFDISNGFKQNQISANNITWMWKRAPSYFDVVAYTGTGSNRTVSHNLSAVPEMIWTKNRDASANWCVYHKGLNGGTNPENYKVFLNLTNAESTGSNRWNDTAPTSSVFSVGTSSQTNGSGNDMIAYLFATVAGVSKVGSYSHTNGSATNVDCGFSNGARFIIIKRTDSTSDWRVFDSVRGIVSGNDNYLLLNDTDAESVYDFVDPLSSGFTVASNYDTGDYIFYAIA